MIFKKYNKQANAVSWFLLAIAGTLLAVLTVIILVSGNNKQARSSLVITSRERSFEILGKSASGYQMRALDNQAEENILGLQEGLKAKTVVILKRYIEAANGLVAQEAVVLPPLPQDKNNNPLPKNPE